MTHLGTVAHEEELDVPAQAVWSLLLDWPAIGTWMPRGFISSVRCEGQGVGAVRHIVTGKGVDLWERLDAVDAASHTLELSLTGKLPWDLASYRARGQVVRTATDRCRLSWRGTYEMRAGGEPAERVERLLKRSYENMFMGLRCAAARRA